TSVRNPRCPRFTPNTGTSADDLATAPAASSKVPSPPKAMTTSARSDNTSRAAVGHRPDVPASFALRSSITGWHPCASSQVAASRSADSAAGSVCLAMRPARVMGMSLDAAISARGGREQQEELAIAFRAFDRRWLEGDALQSYLMRLAGA